MTRTAPVVALPALELPEHVVTRESLRDTARRVLEGNKLLPRILKIIDNTGIERRHIVRSVEETVAGAGFGGRNDLFIEVSKRLGARAAQRAIEQAGLTAADVDFVITTSCTGIMIPSLDAHLIGNVQAGGKAFRPDTRRLPITELGCAAGTVALSRARELIAAGIARNVLVVAHELSSLTYQPQDFAMAALIGALLFGDGVAATVVRADDADAPRVRGLRLEHNGSFLFDGSWDYMGFDVRDTGLHLILDKGIPGAVERQIAPVLLGFLDRHAVKSTDIEAFAIHPGGPKLVDEVQRVLGAQREQTASSRECLAEVGNLSSASILVVLRNLFERHTPRDGARTIVVGFGPGFSAEMLLGRWQDGA